MLPQALSKTRIKSILRLSVLLGIVIALCGSGSVFCQDFYSYVNGSTATAHFHSVISDSDTAPTQLDVAPNTTTGYGYSRFNSSTTVPGRFSIGVQNLDPNLDLWSGFDNIVGTASKVAIPLKSNESSFKIFNISGAIHLFCNSSTTIGAAHIGCSIYQIGVK